jgi:hypothetical protein
MSIHTTIQAHRALTNSSQNLKAYVSGILEETGEQIAEKNAILFIHDPLSVL